MEVCLEPTLPGHANIQYEGSNPPDLPKLVDMWPSASMERERRFGCDVEALLARCAKAPDRVGCWNELLLPADPAAATLA